MTHIESSDKTTNLHELVVLFSSLKLLDSLPILKNTNVYMCLYHKYFTIQHSLGCSIQHTITHLWLVLVYLI